MSSVENPLNGTSFQNATTPSLALLSSAHVGRLYSTRRSNPHSHDMQKAEGRAGAPLGPRPPIGSGLQGGGEPSPPPLPRIGEGGAKRRGEGSPSPLSQRKGDVHHLV